MIIVSGKISRNEVLAVAVYNHYKAIAPSGKTDTSIELGKSKLYCLIGQRVVVKGTLLAPNPCSCGGFFWFVTFLLC